MFEARGQLSMDAGAATDIESLAGRSKCQELIKIKGSALTKTALIAVNMLENYWHNQPAIIGRPIKSTWPDIIPKSYEGIECVLSPIIGRQLFPSQVFEVFHACRSWRLVRQTAAKWIQRESRERGKKRLVQLWPRSRMLAFTIMGPRIDSRHSSYDPTRVWVVVCRIYAGDT